MDNFQAYGEFARVYDMFQDNVDYQTWGKWLKQQLAAQGITDGLVLDLGCGTGTMTEILAEDIPWNGGCSPFAHNSNRRSLRSL